MLSSLEGMLVALIMAISPADHSATAVRQHTPTTVAANAGACDRFLDMLARHNCVVRASRSAAAEASALFPSRLTWIAPRASSLDRFQLLQRMR